VTEILTKRDEIRSSAKQKLGENLARYGIIVDDIYISDIAFSPDYQTAIEKKQTAQQSVETERQILEQKRVQAEQAVAEAQGKARAAVESAKGEADANRARTESISPQLIEYLRWTRWDGRLPLFQGGQQPLISVPLDTVGAGTTPQVQPSPQPQPQTQPQPAQPTPQPQPKPTAAPQR
jgi:regulator of protease activity HflC (stomatin/prohibitin superfamily)